MRTDFFKGLGWLLVSVICLCFSGVWGFYWGPQTFLKTILTFPPITHLFMLVCIYGSIFAFGVALIKDKEKFDKYKSRLDIVSKWTLGIYTIFLLVLAEIKIG